MPTSTPTSRWIANPTYEDYYRAAAVAFEARDVRLCVEQLAAALSLDPTGERALALVEQLVGVFPGVLSELPRGGDAFFGLVALRALLMAPSDVNGALELLEEVVGFRPAVPYVQWLERWLEQWTLAATDQQALGRSIGRMCRSLFAASPKSMQEVNGFHANLRSLAIVAQRAWAEGARQSTFLDVAVSCIAKLGCEATSAQPWLDSLAPQHKFELLNGLSRLALTECRYADATDLALQAFDHGPVSPTGREVTLQLIEAGAFSEARRVLSRLATESSARSWAETHRAFVEAVMGDVEALHGLGVRAQQQDQIALALYKEVGVYRTHLPDPWDSASASVRRALKAAASSGVNPLQDAQRQALCPSACIALEAGLTQLDLKGEASAGAVAMATHRPFPWEFVSKGAVEAVRSPGAVVADRVRAVAEMPFDLATWARAVEWVRRLELCDVEGEIAACFAGVLQQGATHPIAWLFRVQVTSALGLAALVTTTESRAAQMLVELVGLANDWSSAAAALAIGHLGRRHVAYEDWAKSTLSAVLACGALPNTAAEHAIVVTRSWFEGSVGEFGELWSRRMKLSPR